MTSATPPDPLLENREIAELNKLRPQAKFVYDHAPGGSFRRQVDKEEFDKQNAQIDTQIAEVPARRALARAESSEKFRCQFRASARTSHFRQAFWRAADRER